MIPMQDTLEDIKRQLSFDSIHFSMHVELDIPLRTTVHARGLHSKPVQSGPSSNLLRPQNPRFNRPKNDLKVVMNSRVMSSSALSVAASEHSSIISNGSVFSSADSVFSSRQTSTIASERGSVTPNKDESAMYPDTEGQQDYHNSALH